MRQTVICLFFLFFSCSNPAAAKNRGVVFVGGSASDAYNVHGGAVVALPGEQLGRGLALRISGSTGKYHYSSDGVGINGEYNSGEMALVYQSSGTWGWANLSAGPRITHLKLVPADPHNPGAGTRWETASQADGQLGTGSFNMGWLASYGFSQKAFLFQLRPGKVLDNGPISKVGLEAVVQGDTRYSARGAGLFANSRLTEQTEIRAAVGATDQAGREPKPYFSLALATLF